MVLVKTLGSLLRAWGTLFHYNSLSNFSWSSIWISLCYRFYFKPVNARKNLRSLWQKVIGQTSCLFPWVFSFSFLPIGYLAILIMPLILFKVWNNITFTSWLILLACLRRAMLILFVEAPLVKELVVLTDLETRKLLWMIPRTINWWCSWTLLIIWSQNMFSWKMLLIFWSLLVASWGVMPLVVLFLWTIKLG